MYEIPKITSIPDDLYYDLPLTKARDLLGFVKKKDIFIKRYTNSISAFDISMCDALLAWNIGIYFYSQNKRTIFCPTNFFIRSDLTQVELLSLFCLEWISAFGKKTIPYELSYGKTYIDYLSFIKESHPCPERPCINVERETFRFFINKIKREINFNTEDCIVELLYKNGQLKISVKSIEVFVPATTCCEDIKTGKIILLVGDFIKGIPKRFNKHTVSLCIMQDGLHLDFSIIKAHWDGPDIWKSDEYDKYCENYKYYEYLRKRLYHVNLFPFVD